MQLPTGKPISEKVEDFAAKVGFGMIILLMVFVFYNDLMHFGPTWFKGKAVLTEQKGEK